MTESEVAALLERARYSGPTVTAEQLIGVESCLRQLAGQLALIARPELARRFGLEPSGTLFIGPPGKLDVPLYQLSADEFGAEPETLHAVFRRLTGERALLFSDEISILAQKREWGDAEDRRLLAALLTSLDGVSSAGNSGRLWVVGACTPDIQLDPAIYRSGRLGVVIEFAPPSEEQRRRLFELYLANVPHSLTSPDIDRLAEAANGATGADVRDWVSQAASEVLSEADSDEPVIDYRHLEAVVARRGFIAAEDRAGRAPNWETAVHEAAHAVIAYRLFGREALAKVTMALWSSPQLGQFERGHFELSFEWLADNAPNSKTWRDHVSISLAGICAEQILLGYRGQGGERDVANATNAILSQFDAADPAFGPGRSSIEASSGSHYAVAGSGAMRRLAWNPRVPGSTSAGGGHFNW
jgi:hypothetical protein